MLITSHEEAGKLRQAIFSNAKKSRTELQKCADNMEALQLFAYIKFDKMGVDPITGEKLNLIEQINQMYSDLVILAAVQDLLDRYPGKAFEIHLGTTAGYDVESTDGQVVAECFAVTSVRSNDKMNKDCLKLMQSEAKYKHLFYYTYQDSEKVIENRINKYPQIHFERIY